MNREIDSRRIEGGAGTVYMALDDEGGLAVYVHDYAGKPVAVLEHLTAEQALSAYRHTFADPRVPDIFRRAIVLEDDGSAERYDDEGPNNEHVVHYCASCGSPLYLDDPPHQCKVNHG
jgi:hypothetical protein